MIGSKLILWGASVLALTFCTSNVMAQKQRLSWTDMSKQQQDNYINAVAESMDRGLHARFAEIHSNKPTTNYAHGNCGFVLWHRKFLLAYEAMLQDMGYGQVMLPYWNYFADHDNHMFISNKCRNWAECSPYLQAHGGSDGRAPIRTHNIFGAKITGNCVSKGVAGHACSNPRGKSSGRCENCIIRSNWAASDRFLALDKGDIFDVIQNPNKEGVSSVHSYMSDKAQGGYHAQVHNALAKTMSNMIAPFDPVFYGHHATIDLVGFIHNHCYLKNDKNVPLNRRGKYFDIFQFCRVRTEGDTVLPNSDIKYIYNGRPASQDPQIGKYFRATDNKYSSVKDTEKLSGKGQKASYVYKLDSYLTKFLMAEGVTCPDGVFAKNQLSLKAHLDHEKAKAAGKKDDCKGTELMDILIDCQEELKSSVYSNTEATTTVCVRQTDVLECEAVRQRSGVDFTPYSKEFREIFQLPDDCLEPNCKTILDQVKSGELVLELSDECRSLYGKATGTDLSVEGFGKAMSKHSDSIHHGKTAKSKENHVHLKVRVH